MAQNPHVTLDVYDYGGKKLCALFDSRTKANGQAYNVVYTESIKGTKTLSFSIPYLVGKKRNFRWKYIKNEYQVR